MACRVVRASKTGLLGRGLQSPLDGAGTFEVMTVLGVDEALAGAIGDHGPDAVIIASGALSVADAQVVLNTALIRRTMSVLSVSVDTRQPPIWHSADMVAGGRETGVDALRRLLTVSA